MTLQVIGAICIIFSLLRGGIKLKDSELPSLSTGRRIAFAAAGVAFIALGVYTNEQPGATEWPIPEITAQAPDNTR